MNVLRVEGFLASGVHCGLKREGLDLGLIYCPSAACAGLFTTNQVKAAPVLLSQERIRGGRCGAVLVNSGNANACTGRRGQEDARALSARVAKLLNIPPQEVLVASTGIIGRRLPRQRMEAVLPQLVHGLGEDLEPFSRAILTTDTHPKVCLRDLQLGGTKVRLCGIAKGAGMIMPRLATTLCFLLTDLRAEPAMLREALAWAADRTLNLLTVDGETSTNDTLLLLASGRAGNAPVSPEELAGALKGVLGELARMIARDGEGATKLVEVEVEAVDLDSARLAAFAVANSPLVKSALHGGWSNWGRIMAALGRSGAVFDPEEVDILLNGTPVALRGEPVPGQTTARLEGDRVVVEIRLGRGHRVRVLSCDLSPDYVRLNAQEE